jgi:hypothetical protein
MNDNNSIGKRASGRRLKSMSPLAGILSYCSMMFSCPRAPTGIAPMPCHKKTPLRYP